MLDALIAAATVDCYNDSECVTGFYTMLDEQSCRAVSHRGPRRGRHRGRALTLTDDEQIMAVCAAQPIDRSASQSWTFRCLHHSPTGAGSGSRVLPAG